MKSVSSFVLLFVSVLFFTGCSSRRFIPEGEYLLESVKVTCDDPNLRASSLSGYVRQQPNSKWFSALKVPMGPWLLQRGDTTHWGNRLLRRIGEEPVVYDRSLAERSRQDILAAVSAMGWLNAEVDMRETPKKHKMRLQFIVRPGLRTYVRDIQYEFADSLMRNLYFRSIRRSSLYTGIPFNLSTLDQERSRVVALYQRQGYYKFNRTYVHYLADTTRAIGTAALRLQVLPTQSGGHHRYIVDSARFDSQALRAFRHKVLKRACRIRTGELYNEQDVADTYNRLARLAGVANSAIHFTEVRPDTLCADVSVNMAKLHSLQFSPEATNTAGDFGAAVALTYQNRNAFRGGETFSLKLRTAYEAVKGLEGYTGSGYFEYSVEGSVKFPSFKLPLLSSRFRENSIANTEVSVMYDSQNRPEFHRRVLTGALRYRWSKYNGHMQHRLDLLDLNYIFMPWISSTFRRDYLDNATSRNAILRYNYENLFIMKLGYTYSYASRPLVKGTNIRRTTSYSLRASVETAGNLLQAASAVGGNRLQDDGYRHFLGIAYAQYIKGDFSYSRSRNLDDRNSLAWRTYVGVAVPYGNSNILPYEKRYFSGGANSVRGWSVRGLGPGKFRGNDGRIDFINQTGDVKLDMSVELRSQLFWKIQGALFIDAGNIWTLRDYAEQPGGQFRWNKFWQQIAVAYGLGIRFNFDYFVVRLDGGMKAVNPAYDDTRRHYPVAHPRFSRDLSVHFAVGLPF